MDIFPIETWEHILAFTDEISRISHRFVCSEWYALLKRFDPPCAPANYTTLVYAVSTGELTKWAMENGAPRLGNDLLINILNVWVDEVDKVACKFVCRKWRLLLFDVRSPKNYLVQLLQREQFNVISWALYSARAREYSNICSYAMLRNVPNIAIRARDNGCPIDFDGKICENIALGVCHPNRPIEILKWAMSYGAEVDEGTYICVNAEITEILRNAPKRKAPQLKFQCNSGRSRADLFRNYVPHSTPITSVILDMHHRSLPYPTTLPNYTDTDPTIIELFRNGTPYSGGVYDARMGATVHENRMETID
jgi:hypothetical protein